MFQCSHWRLKLLRIATSLCVAGILSCDLKASEKPANEVYHSQVSEVRLVFFATQDNRAVKALQKEDFVVFDDEKVIRNFTGFTPADQARLDVILLLDCSDSVLPRFKKDLPEVMRLIAEWPGNPEDEVSVLSFSGQETHLVCAGDCTQPAAADRLAALPSGGTTPLFDALDTAVTLLEKRRKSDVWPVVVLFSDGNDNASLATYGRILERTIASETQVYAIDMGPAATPSNGRAILRAIAEGSGGRYLPATVKAQEVFHDVIDDLRSGFVVTYALPRSRSDFHSVRILPTHNSNLHFRSRGGYSITGATH